MELKQLRAFLTVAEIGSVTKAAQLLHFVQPAITRQIQHLEAELGVPLFERTRLGMTLTPAGETLADGARRAIAELEQAKSNIRPTSGTVSGRVRLGLLESLLDILTEPVIKAVSEHYPMVELQLLTAPSGQLQKWLDEGELDLSLLYGLESTSSISTVPLTEDELWAVGPVEANLSSAVPVACETVFKHPLVLPQAGHGLRTLIDPIITSPRAAISSYIEANSIYLQKSLVRTGYGWTILPAVGVIADIRNGTLTGAPLTDPSLRREVVLGMPRVNRTSLPIRAVATEIREAVRQLVADGSWPGVTIDDTPVSPELVGCESLSADQAAGGIR